MEGVERRKTRLSLGISDSKKDINKGINKESEEVKESPKVKKLKVDSSASKTKKCEESKLQSIPFFYRIVKFEIKFQVSKKYIESRTIFDIIKEFFSFLKFYRNLRR